MTKIHRSHVLLVAALITLATSSSAFAKTVRYELTATRGSINLSGYTEVDWALIVNGSIPAPTLEFTEGDDAEIEVINRLDEEVSIHWHGILLPPEMDGVAYVNTPPILPGARYTFRFKIRQHGTYWYHSHTMLQEQKGVYGAIVIHPRERRIAYDEDVVVVLSDWSDENPDQIIRNLRKDGDYYLYKKNAVRSWFGAWQADALGVYVANEWDRMGGMDLSDVGYDAFLMNGRRSAILSSATPGRKLRVRVINAAASSYFYLSLGQAPMRVIAADGVDTKPTLAKEILLGMAETYDLLVEVPAGKRLELRATAQDGTGSASGWIGTGEDVRVPDRPKPPLYAAMDHAAMGHSSAQDHAAMGHSSAQDHAAMGHGSAQDHAAMGHSSAQDHAAMGHGSAQDHAAMGHSSAQDHAAMGHSSAQDHAAMGHTSSPSTTATLTVDEIEAPAATAFPSKPAHTVKLVLGGDMERYVWHINGKAIHEERTLEINAGDIVRFTFVNDTMMHHPMHLHGHFFRVLTAKGATSPLKHTVDVPPHGTRTIEFLADEPGEWMLHCHNLYHMKTGMARVVRYSTFVPKPEVAAHQQHDPHLHDHLYFDGRVELFTHRALAAARLSKTWDTLEAEVETHIPKPIFRKNDAADRAQKIGDELEGALIYRRWLSGFLNLAAGATLSKGDNDNDDDKRVRGIGGVGYMLPMLIESDLFVDHRGAVRIDLEKRLQWTGSVYSDLEVRLASCSEPEWAMSLLYGPAWAWGVGFSVTEDDLGFGGMYRF